MAKGRKRKDPATDDIKAYKHVKPVRMLSKSDLPLMTSLNLNLRNMNTIPTLFGKSMG